MPNRIARDSARKSKSLAKLTDFGERGFWRLVLAADDFGRFIADPAIILAECFPRMLDRVSLLMCEQMLRECVAADLIVLYEVDGVTYGQFVKADKYFTRRAKGSKYPSAPQTHRTGIASAPEVSRGEGRGARGEEGSLVASPEQVKELLRNTTAALAAPGQQWLRTEGEGGRR